MITAAKGILELSNFGHMTTWLTLQNFVGDDMDIKYDLHNTFVLRRPRVASFANMIKIATTFFKKTFNDSKKVKRIGNHVLKCKFYLYFL